MKLITSQKFHWHSNSISKIFSAVKNTIQSYMLTLHSTFPNPRHIILSLVYRKNVAKLKIFSQFISTKLMVSENKGLLFNFSVKNYKKKFRKKKHLFMITMNLNFFHKIFQTIAFLNKKLKISIVIFFNFNFFSLL